MFTHAARDPDRYAARATGTIEHQDVAGSERRDRLQQRRLAMVNVTDRANDK